MDDWKRLGPMCVWRLRCGDARLMKLFFVYVPMTEAEKHMPDPDYGF